MKLTFKIESNFTDIVAKCHSYDGKIYGKLKSNQNFLLPKPFETYPNTKRFLKTMDRSILKKSDTASGRVHLFQAGFPPLSHNRVVFPPAKLL